MGIAHDRRAAVKKLKLLVYTPKSDVNSFRNRIEEAYACPVLPNRVECSEHNYGGVVCDVLVPEIYSSRRIMMYIHGGSFVGGSRASWRTFCARIANKAYSRVVVPEFRLAPAHPFPAAVEDVQAVFRAFFTEEQVACSLDSSPGEKPSVPDIIIAADGSGASVAMALLFNLRERYRSCISHVILLSPWLDMSDDSHLADGKKTGDEILSSESLYRCGEVYTYASNLANPLVSPLKSAKELLSGFPPVYIQMGEKEILLGDAKKFKALLGAAGVKCELDVWPGMMHSFQLSDDCLWETHLAIEKIGQVVSSADKMNVELFDNKPRLENSIRADA
ncbi:MAG TPA: acetyl hydrolase [Treponema sp.]|nr:acetyl hydrolase [Treponema sp.]